MVSWEKAQLLWQIIIPPIVDLSAAEPMGRVLWRLWFSSPRTLPEIFSILKGLHGKCAHHITLWEVITFFFLIKKNVLVGECCMFYCHTDAFMLRNV